MNWWWVFDVVVITLATLRVTRLVTTDSIGQWWLYGPLYKKAVTAQENSRWAKYVEGLVCPFCVGFWIGVAGLGALFLAGGPGQADEWLRWLAGAFALNYVVGHVANWLD